LTIKEKYVSERDFVARYLFQRFNSASKNIKVDELTTFNIERRINSGIADLTVERAGKPALVIEAKFKKKIGNVERDVEPRDPEVIKQAVSYAVLGGYPYYATCNANRIILYQLQPGIKLFESEIASYNYSEQPDWADNILSYVLGLEKAEPQPLDDVLVNILLEAYNDLYPQFVSSLRSKLDEMDFLQQFVEWLETQGYQLSDDTIRLIASQSTYMELNKFLFYHIIRLIYPEFLPPLQIDDHQDVSRSLEKFYMEVLKIDYAPIYEKTIISEIPLTNWAEERIRTLLDTLNLFDFSQIESDFIGSIYEKLIPPLERKRLGQFYTPAGIVDLIIQLSVRNINDIVIDPACGSGSFLVRAYHRLRELNRVSSDIRDIEAVYHFKRILSQIYGVDINQFPAHLSVINLAIQNPYAKIDKINVLVEDFFNIKPGVSTLTGFQSLSTDGNQTEISLPPYFDVVIGNPPYIRQELLGAKEKKAIKSLIENEYKNKLIIGASSKKNIININKQSDIYIYFFLHGLKLLRDKGKLGFITSNKWLEVSYGIPFQKYLLENTNIKYIIEFDRAIFPDAEVNTAITLIEKTNIVNKRNQIKFIRFKKKLSVDDMVNIINTYETSYENEDYKINILHQSKLEPGKWNIYLRAPAVYSKISEHDLMNPLSEIAEVIRAPTTGNNDYFILTQETVKDYEIEKEYLEPCIRSAKDVDDFVVTETQDYMLFMDKPKNQLKDSKVIKYIEYGETKTIDIKRGSERGIKKLPEISTLKNRKPFWYSLPKREAPPILFPRLIDKKPIFLRNIIGAHTTHVFYYIYPHKMKDADVLLGFLNSSLMALMIELNGRSYGGGVLELLVYELKNIMVINPEKLSDKIKSDIVLAYHNLLSSRDDLKAEKQNALDEIVYDAFGLSVKEREMISDGLKELQEIRLLRRAS